MRGVAKPIENKESFIRYQVQKFIKKLTLWISFLSDDYLDILESRGARIIKIIIEIPIKFIHFLRFYNNIT